MKKVKYFMKIVDTYKEDADFVVVYIRETHLVDGWSLAGSTSIPIYDHKALDTRVEAAMILKDTCLDVPIFVDNMNNEALLAYGSFPERLYIVYNNVIAYEGGKGPIFCSVSDMEKALLAILKQR